MLSANIKEATLIPHQQLEKKVVNQLKNIRNHADYAKVLKNFYAYFKALEEAIKPYITTKVLPDYAERRNSTYLKQDIEELGSDVNDIPAVTVPNITNAVEAMGALYVMEGSIMGGPYIVQMLQKYGMEKGFSFFEGYGDDTGRVWNEFITRLNAVATTDDDGNRAIQTANETFANFGNLFDAKAA